MHKLKVPNESTPKNICYSMDFIFLCDRTQTKVLEGCSSDTATVDSGVPQGSVLGTVLFLKYKLSS